MNIDVTETESIKNVWSKFPIISEISEFGGLSVSWIQYFDESTRRSKVSCCLSFGLDVWLQPSLWPVIMVRLWCCVVSRFSSGSLEHMLYVALSLALSPGWTLTSGYSLVFSLISGPVCFCSRLISTERPCTQFITPLSVPVDGPHYQHLALPGVFLST